MNSIAAKIWLLVCLAICGCSSTIASPNWCHPGWADEQRNRAQRFDPYPEPDVGPDVVGGRPREYMEPAAEPQRVQNQRTFTRRFGQLAPRSRY